MNSAAACHEIPGCRGLYVDAFRGKYLPKTRDENNAFILTHYHGDHYGSLPREGKYRGPAFVHCTPVTAALLRNVHEVPDAFLVEHSYGETWTFRPPPPPKKKEEEEAGSVTGPSTTGNTKSAADGDADEDRAAVKITFYDANHCPGAALVLAELPDGKVHLHTGDMRYHERMEAYPLLRAAASARRIDTVLLDTTYSDPRHEFDPQEAAVDTIAAQVKELLGDGGGGGEPSPSRNGGSKSKTLVLLSCYSIGKEKVLWEASTRTNQLVYVSDKKLRMLECIRGHGESISSQIVQRTTRNPDESDVHVVPMGTAGEMWPYFQPNFGACADYANDLTKPYDRVVAFIPTGWADATNWNRKNAVSRSDNCKGLEVEVRLIGYSEHSAFSELQAFVRFVRPRKVVPTVFKDENDLRKIEARFPVDSGRAKQHFFNSMVSSKNTTAGKPSREKEKMKAEVAAATSPVAAAAAAATSPVGDRKRKLSGDRCNDGIASLQAMGFDTDAARVALEARNGDVESAVATLLRVAPTKVGGNRTPKTTQPKRSPATNTAGSKQGKGGSKRQQPTMLTFFARKGS